MQLQTVISPLTGREAPLEKPPTTEVWYQVFRHDKDGFADFFMTAYVFGRLDRNYTYHSSTREYTHDEREAGLKLIRSYLWRGKNMDLRPLIVTTADEHADLISKLEKQPQPSSYRIKSVEEFIEEAMTLSFTQKALYTLENIRSLWIEHPNILQTRTDRDALLKKARLLNKADSLDDGLIYGSGGREAEAIVEYLVTEGLVSNQGDHIRPLPKAYVELDKLTRGRSKSIRRAFVIRRFDHTLDSFLKPVMDAVGKELDCTIAAVWEEPHNDKIDERIFRLIRQSAFVIADVSTDVGSNPDRVNVGIELGYALALRKRAIVIRRRPAKKLSAKNQWKKQLPFDIITAHCTDYDVTEEGANELTAKIVARAAIELANQEQDRLQ